jgi:hypothetical protein
MLNPLPPLLTLLMKHLLHLFQISVRFLLHLNIQIIHRLARVHVHERLLVLVYLLHIRRSRVLSYFYLVLYLVQHRQD